MKTLFCIPPMTQLNTPYPATAYLTGFLREQGFVVAQRDLAIELLLTLLTPEGLEQILGVVEDNYAEFEDDELPDVIYQFMAEFEQYRQCVTPAIRFLQGKDPSLALRIVSRRFLPEGPAFEGLHGLDEATGDILQWAFGELGTQDKAKHLATLFIDDLVQVIHQGVDVNFEISRYGESLAASNPSFDDLYGILNADVSLVEATLQHLVVAHLQETQPDVLGITVPFPGNMLGALQIARACREHSPNTHIVLGGGYINTELRSLSDPRIFEFVDFILLDDGEQPLLRLYKHLLGNCERQDLHRTYYLDDGAVCYQQQSALPDIPHRAIGTPVYEGLPLDSYLSLCEMLNPMHRIWSDGRWNKLTMAHGCYWTQCSFCDIGLDYIGRYDEAGADIIVERIETLIAETGQTGFHFVDEAAPPKVMFAMARKLIEKGIVITWWGNIRFEKTFTPERCQLLADSGCVAVSGGLEVASDRLLKLMKKGVTVEQVARVTKAFSDAGILVHAYLMYGFPSQTEAETVDSLEYVRQLMMHKCIHSAYWHRFSATIHSPVGQKPEQYGVTLHPPAFAGFASNDIEFSDPVVADHELLGKGLKKALYNYMHGLGFEQPVGFWFDKRLAKPSVKANMIEKALEKTPRQSKVIPIQAVNCDSI
ncbi:B12-binding domain-containing radical SAM protein [Leucothrix mucor]|uniref:B12-binding domain-containing radical SAM protein n=1 Tax=Leucothrix mucor TaxID=45248 RepID=UPI000A041839|nr:radical SAM protein [Leucothrix mucor]